MPSGLQIEYVKAPFIDKKKWDRCISSAPNGLVYAVSFYLDTMAPGWDALVLNDYEVVMPLPTRKKWGRRYIFQPSMTPILGVFGAGTDKNMVDHFLRAIPKDLSLWDLSLNAANEANPATFPLYRRTNCILSLARNYASLQDSYSENTRRNIRKAAAMNCVVRKSIPLSDIIAICRTEFPKFTKVEPGLFEKLDHIYHEAGLKTASYGVYDEKCILQASAAFIFFRQRVYYWLVGNSSDSKKYNASYLLMDAFIRDHAGTDLILDFEGSDTKSVADFYLKFGAHPEYFTSIFYNRLPFPISLLKKTPPQYGARIS
jgi:hypothetical protein